MKKMTLMLMMLALAVALSGCCLSPDIPLVPCI